MKVATLRSETLRSESTALPVFMGLQCLDVATTLLFLSRGVEEGNPLVSWALSNAHSPWVGLIVAKMAAAFVGQYLYRSGRLSLLRRANIGYGMVVAWNLVAITATLLAR